MKHWFKFCILLLFSGYGLVSCDEDIDDSKGTGTEGTVEIAEVTYLIYMVGQNDLSSFLNSNISDLKTGYKKTTVKSNILVYADINKTPHLYLLEKDKQGEVKQTTVKTYPDQYSVDPKIMTEVINEVFTRYPAKYKGITFSSHADGSLYRSQTVPKRSFGYEGSAGYGMNITDIREALDAGPYFDLIMFDACLMASVETAYELKDNGHYFMATPNSVPGEGFPYDKVLPSILKMNAEGFTNVAQIYMEHFHHNAYTWDDFVAISVSDMTKMDSLALYMDSLFQSPAVQERPSTLSRFKLQMYESGFELYDYGQWVDSLGRKNRFVPKIKDALDKVIVYKAHSDYSSVNDYTEDLEIPITSECFSGFNTYVPPKGVNIELSQRMFFTTLRWYEDAGFLRSSKYNVYEIDE